MADLFTERKNLICRLVEDPHYVPMKEKELAVFMQVKPGDREELTRALESLLAEGRLMRTKRGRYQKPEETELTGIFAAHAKGFGFVRPEGTEGDVYIPEECVHGAFDGDTVKITLRPQRSGQRPEGEVTEIVVRAFTQVVGTYEQSKNFGFVIPDNQKLLKDIYIAKENRRGAVDGHKVVAEITDYGKSNRSPEGKIVEILGHANDPGVDILSLVRAYGLPEAFPERVRNQAQRVAGCGQVSEADRAGRRDLRDVVMVTIDGEDAKDLDDAVSLTVGEELYHLGVHIADVANYVQENSALDWEAKERGTSVYLADRVIPMLPHALSNGICSLNAGEDRLALSCLMDIDRKGNVVNYEITESVIRVDRRMSYTDVKKILEDRDDTVCKEHETLVPMFEQMALLSSILRQKRKERGAVDFDFPECKIVLDRQGNPLEIRPYERNVATNLIEDFMLAANETVAQHFYWLETPFVYRVHDHPDPEKMEKLALFLHNFGYHIRMNSDGAGSREIRPGELQRILEQADSTPEEALIARLALRSMKRASYDMACAGHFGLATRYYCHFTSPIRRYPDLQIHRIIKEFLRGRLTEERIAHYREILPGVAEHSSKTERRADEAERETDKLKKVQYMEAHIGEEFTGVVSGVTGWGLYVELSNTVEGLVHISSLEGDYFLYDEAHYELKGQATGKTYRLGQTLRVKAASADRFQRTIDFVLAGGEEYGEGSAEAGGE